MATVKDLLQVHFPLSVAVARSGAGDVVRKCLFGTLLGRLKLYPAAGELAHESAYFGNLTVVSFDVLFESVRQGPLLWFQHLTVLARHATAVCLSDRTSPSPLPLQIM